MTAAEKKLPSITQVLQRLALFRMFLPLISVSFLAIGVIGYFAEQTLENQQKQKVRFVVNLIDYQLEEAIRSLEAIARVTDGSSIENILFLQDAWKAFRHFDTIYHLDTNYKIKLLVPYDERYLGLDLSNISSITLKEDNKFVTISRPFISLRTGNPTIYLVQQLANGEHLVGELNLGSLQDDVIRQKGTDDKGATFILDQFGMLLAHPSFSLVKQQTNLGSLMIFHKSAHGDITAIYDYENTMVLGSATRIGRTGWVVVNQILLAEAFRPYTLTLGLTLMLLLAIWFILTWNLRKHLHSRIVLPLLQLSQGVTALTRGEFAKEKIATSAPAYAELNALAVDFQRMSDTLAARQLALQESEERYRTLFEQVPISLFRTAPDGRHLAVNPANVQMLGYPDAKTLLSINVKDLYVDLDDRRRWLEIAETNQVINNFEARLRRFDSSIIWVRLTCRLIRDEQGEVLYYEGSAEDISERKQSEASVRKLSQAVQQSPISIVITDASGRIEFVNTKFTEVTGFTSAEVIGKNPKILASGQTPRETYRHLWQTIRSGGVWRGEFHNRKKNGEIFVEHATIAAVKNGEGNITHFVAMKEDITERKRLEEQLRQTLKMESVGQLAGGVAHDFNNMLGVILGHAELALNKTSADDARRQHLEAIQTAGQRSMEITRQLLAFARKQTIQPKIVDLNSTVEGMLKLLRRLIGENIDLQWLPGPSLWPIKMDPTQIDQILANLCVNARDAITTGGRIIIETGNITLDEAFCTLHNGFIPGEFVMLAVGDNGIGMDKTTLSKIFEPFFTTKGLGKGTGLGLATIYGIVKQNGGFISAYSEIGQGSVFKIYLPRCTVKLEQPIVQKEKAEYRPPPGHETILLVEDDGAVLAMAKEMLTDLGYLVMSAPSAKEAIELVRRCSGRVDLIITDLVMPEMTGKEMTNHLTALYPNLKCLYMSGYTSNVIAHQSVLEEGVNFIQKPFTQHDMAVKLRTILEEKKQTN